MPSEHLSIPELVVTSEMDTVRASPPFGRHLWRQRDSPVVNNGNYQGSPSELPTIHVKQDSKSVYLELLVFLSFL
jgi:hypothetical protein